MCNTVHQQQRNGFDQLEEGQSKINDNFKEYSKYIAKFIFKLCPFLWNGVIALDPDIFFEH